MNQLSKGSRGGTAPSHRSLDLILQARALRYRWFAATLARLSTSLTRACTELVTRAGRPRRRAASGVLRPAIE